MTGGEYPTDAPALPDAPRPLASAAPTRWAAIRLLFVHLRLPFQFVFAPIFLWGWLLSGGDGTWRVALAFIALHLFLYGGTTAFNSAFDHDEGPVSGLEHPPPVPPALLPFSLAWKGIGWLLAAFVNLPFVLAYTGYLALSIAYSHPCVRLKARPIASLLVISLGQGALVFLGAWGAARGEVASLVSPTGLAGMVVAALLVLSFYPLTQIYQIDEDRARGDRTLAVAWGPVACFAVAIVCQLAGGLALVALLYARYGLADALVVGAGLLGQVVILLRWAAHFAPGRIVWNYRRVILLNVAAGGGLGLYFIARLLLH
ncbi:MAG: UbiA family prenyltransferase [Thermomicrobiales bacterium]